MDSPLFNLIIFAGALYLFKLWFADYKQQEAGTPNPNALPGATRVGLKWIIVAIFGAIGLTIIETLGEYQLGVSAEQSDIPAILIFAMVGAGIIEEIVFRGYFVIDNKGKNILIASIFAVSLIFALGHYQYYTVESESGPFWGHNLNFESKSLWTLFILFLNSLWFYAVRFLPQNPNRSMLPCFAAHIASNLSVFFIKLVQGHVTTLL